MEESKERVERQDRIIAELQSALRVTSLPGPVQEGDTEPPQVPSEATVSLTGPAAILDNSSAAAAPSETRGVVYHPPRSHDLLPYRDSENMEDFFRPFREILRSRISGHDG